MRRIVSWLLATIGGLVLLFSYHTSTMGPAGPTKANGLVALPAGSVATPAATAPASSTGNDSPAAGTPAAGAPPATGGDTVVNGPSVPTRRGPVQVQIKVQNGRLTDVVAVVLPDSNYRDERINAYAVPILRQEALDAQSSNIDSVSGATVTSDGYVASLQAALDSVHLGGK